MITWRRSFSTWARSFSFSERAVVSPWNQETVSRKGRLTRSAAISNGRSPPATVPWKPSSAVERNETVIRTSESRTRPPTMIRRFSALDRFEG